ncbi:hypothetical protein ACFLYB_00045 [Chloroflexota bacterium]
MKEINCLICSNPLSIRMAKGRSSNKPFIMLVCPNDGRHFRAFISDQDYIKKILDEKGDSKAEGIGKRGRPRTI